MKRSLKSASLLKLVGVLFAVLMVLGCTEAAEDGDPGAGDTLPDSIAGTVALEDGTSASFEMDFGELQGSGGGFAASATAPVTGNVRYQSEDHGLVGEYDDSDNDLSPTATNDTTGAYFEFTGTYTSAAGYVATVEYFNSDGELLASGVASGTGFFSGDTTTSVYLGTFSGDQGSSGTWNGTLTDTEFYGTYAFTGFGISGTFTAERDGNTVSGFVDNGETTTAVGTISDDGQTISGTWSEVEESGTWVGSKVDNQGDAPPAGADSDPVYLLNLIEQAFDSVDVLLYDIVDFNDDGILNVFDELAEGAVPIDVSGVEGIDAASYLLVEDGSELLVAAGYVVFDSTGYTDPATGVNLSNGEFEYDGSVFPNVTIDIDSDVGNDVDDGGLTVTWPDDTTSELFVNATANESTETVSGTWELDGTSFLSTIQEWFYQ